MKTASTVVAAPRPPGLRPSVTQSRRSGKPTDGAAWRRGFLAPLIVVLLATTIVPIIYTIVLSLGPDQGQLSLTGAKGFGNYRTLIHDGSFWNSLWLAAQFLVGSLIIELGLGLLAALLIDRLLPNTKVVRTFLLWPAVLPPIAVALIFKFVLQGDVGMVSYYLGKLGYHQAWLSKPHEAMAVLVGIDAWQYTPFVILLALAALQAFPTEMYEAAALDGARVVQQVRYIVLPVIKPAILAITLLRFIDAIQVFPTIYVLTSGGPGSSTQILTYYNFITFFSQLRFGYGAAVSICVVLFTIVCVVVLLRWQRRVEARW